MNEYAPVPDQPSQRLLLAYFLGSALLSAPVIGLALEFPPGGLGIPAGLACASVNGALFVFLAIRHRRRIVGLRWLGWLVGTEMAMLGFATAFGAASAREMAALSVSISVPFALAAIYLDRRASKTLRTGVAENSFTFGEIGPALDRAGPIAAAVAVLFAIGTATLGGDGVLAGAVLCGALTSPGIVLAWPWFRDVANTELGKRHVLAALPQSFEALSRATHIMFRDYRCFVSEDLSVVGILTAKDTRPGDLAMIGIGLTHELETEVSQALLNFGVGHRIRVKPATGIGARGEGIVEGSFADPIGVVSLGPVEAMKRIGFFDEELAPGIGHHLELDRLVLLVGAHAPARRVLGALILALPMRKGAIEAVRILRQANYELTLSHDEQLPPGVAASLRQLKLAPTSDRPQDKAADLEVKLEKDAKRRHLICHIKGMTNTGNDMNGGLTFEYEDPRAIPDFLAFASVFVRRRPIVVLVMGTSPLFTVALCSLLGAQIGWALVFAALVTASIACLAAQSLRFAPRVLNTLAQSRN